MNIMRKKGLIAFLLSATTLVSCTPVEEKLKVSEIRNALASQEGLTSLDEHLNELRVVEQIASSEQPNVEGLEFVSSSYGFTIENLEIELRKREIVCDIKKCNDMLRVTIGEILKTEVAEYLGVKNEELEAFDVTGTRYYTDGFDPERSSFYTVEFTYKDKRFNFVADNSKSYGLCYRYRSCEKRELDYTGLHECYRFIKDALLCNAELLNNKKDIEGRTDKGQSVAYQFDGSFYLRPDKYKKDAIKTYVITNLK